jgi:hypothetical protein
MGLDFCDGVTFLYINDVRTSQKALPWASTACYGDIVTFLYVMMFVPYKEHSFGPPLPVTGITLLYYM